MELYGFARAGVPGEYSPTAVFGELLTDSNNTSSFQTVITKTVVIETPGESLTVVGSFVCQQDFGGGTPLLRLTVDGVDVAQAGKTEPVGGAKSMVRRVVVVSGLAPGPHTVTLDWSNGTSSFIKAASETLAQHAVLLCQRSHMTSRNEMDGYPQAGWPMIYTEPQIYQALTSSNTSTATTPVDSLLSVKVQTRYAQSALLIRFSATGVANGTTPSEVDNLFQLFVDGVARCGTGASTGASGFAGVLSCAGLICVVPVQAGEHTLDVYWCGGASPGTTIDPSLTYPHAAISAEEVVCADVNTICDAEGFSAAQFAAVNLPRVAYASLRDDFTNGGTIVPLLEKVFYVSGDNSALMVEFTGSLESNNQEPVMNIYVDNVLLKGCTATATNGFMQFVAVEAAINAAQGNHLVQVRMNGITSFTPATNPTFSHANMVVREIARLQ